MLYVIGRLQYPGGPKLKRILVMTDRLTQLHHRAIQDLDHISRMAKPSKSGLFKASLRASVTGALAVAEAGFMTLLALPLRVIGKGGLAAIRLITVSDVGQKLYESLPGPSHWMQSTKKLALLSISEFPALLALVGS